MEHEETTKAVQAWLAGRLPADWFTGPVEIAVDREEITITGSLAQPALGDCTTNAELALAAAGRIRGFRADTRSGRIEIARELEHAFGRKVAWAVTCGERRENFTSLSVPVMTRLRQRERLVLDTLVDAGVARSRSDALAWCVRLVGRNADEWLTQLREAMQEVARVRAEGPES